MRDLLSPELGELKPLHPHQVAALDGLRSSIGAGHKRSIVQLPTGAGKTVCAAHVITGVRQRGKRVAFVVPKKSLIDQTYERFVENGIDPALMGVMQADHPLTMPGAPIQICTSQTLSRRSLPDVDVVIVDEAHEKFKIIFDWMEQKPEIIFIGLTATPWSKGLGKYYRGLVKSASMRELIDGGWLSDYRVLAPTHPDLTGVKTVAGDYHEGQLAERMNAEELTADIVNTWLLRADGRPTLCFAINRAHADSIYRRFSDAGVPAAYIDANTPLEERNQIGRDLEAGLVKVVVNIGTCTTGIDWDVRCIILARPTKSEMLFVQMIGRGLRTAPGKDHCIVLDHSDTTLRLGLPEDIDHEHLDCGSHQAAGPRKQRENLRLPRECKAPDCDTLIPYGVVECPVCGFVAKPEVATESDGELQELGAGHKKTSARDILQGMGKQRVYSELMFIQNYKGRSSGWTGHTYKDIFGVWPRGLKQTPQPPSFAVQSYVRSKDIRYAKGRAKGRSEVNHAA